MSSTNPAHSSQPTTEHDLKPVVYSRQPSSFFERAFEKGLSNAAIRIYLALSGRVVNPKGRRVCQYDWFTINITHDYLHKTTRLTRSTISRELGNLKRLGFITYNAVRGRPRRYYIYAWCEDSDQEVIHRLSTGYPHSDKQEGDNVDNLWITPQQKEPYLPHAASQEALNCSTEQVDGKTQRRNPSDSKPSKSYPQPELDSFSIYNTTRAEGVRKLWEEKTKRSASTAKIHELVGGVRDRHKTTEEIAFQAIERLLKGGHDLSDGYGNPIRSPLWYLKASQAQRWVVEAIRHYTERTNGDINRCPALEQLKGWNEEKRVRLEEARAILKKENER